MRRLWLVLVVALAVVAVAPAPAHAQDAAAQKQRREAKRLFNQAHLAYRRGDYEEAILKWEQSYELSEEPLIFLSIANAYERLGDVKQTLVYLQRWRAKAPIREHKELDSRIEGVEERMATFEVEQKKRDEEEARRRAEQEVKLRAELEQNQQQERDKATSNDSFMWQVVGWSLVGTGAAAVIAGVIVDAVAAGKRPAEEEACTESEGQQLCRDALRSDIESSNTLAIAGDITWISGATIAAGGVVVLLLLGYGEYADEPSEDSAAWRIVPVVVPQGGGVSLSARF